MSGFFFLMIPFALCCLVDLVIAVKALCRGGKRGRALGAACLGAFVVTASYSASLFVRSYFWYSVLSSLYFGGIDFTLMSLLLLNWDFINPSGEEKPGWFYRVVCIYGALDMLAFLINPFYEISISYVSCNSPISHYAYEMHPLYRSHLVFSYLMIAVVLVELGRKSIRAPRIYARQYVYCFFYLIAVVLVNGVYLYAPDLFGQEHVDFSLVGYTVIAFTYYWFCYNYSSHGLMSHFHSWIFQNIDQGLVLFDFDNKIMLHNRRVEEMLPAELFREGVGVAEFLSGCGIRYNPGVQQPRYSFLCFVDGHPLRCDYSIQQDKKGRKLGSLFVFSGNTTQYDLLTGFYTWTDFKENAEKLVPAGPEGQIVATFDINSLRDINDCYGRTGGDRALQSLADEMRSQFPPSTVFTRSQEACLVAITTELDKAAVERTVATIQENLQRSTVLNCPIQVQSSVSVRGRAGVVDTIRLNLQSMRTKKLMDRTSVHSELLRSLLQALAQCDPDTGAHVQRTQRTGGELGRRINLSDHDQSNLALLAIMHDIGKIGIPLEILNKPGKLSDSEWAMMKTHVNKGYQIAKSSKEFNEIAEMILYHHERWDGHGYPKGLRGEEIPLLSRIIAVVDAYDAMTNDRAYRKALSESAARSELLRGAGTQFDPNIVREFLEMLEEFDRKQGVTVATMSQQESGDVRQQRDSAAAEERNVQILSYSVYLINDSMQILRVDDAFEAITGYSPSEVADGNMTQYSLIFPEDLQEYQDILHRKMDLDTDLYLRHRLRRKDGSPILVYCYGHDFYDSAVGEKRIRVVIIDSNAPLGQRTEK